MKKRIESINLLGAAYSIEYLEQVIAEDGGWRYGRCFGRLRKILISLKDEDGTPLPERVIQNTICHEIIHAILDEGAYWKLSDNEIFVEWIAKNLQHLIHNNVLDV